MSFHPQWLSFGCHLCDISHAIPVIIRFTTMCCIALYCTVLIFMSHSSSMLEVSGISKPTTIFFLYWNPMRCRVSDPARAMAPICFIKLFFYGSGRDNAVPVWRMHGCEASHCGRTLRAISTLSNNCENYYMEAWVTLQLMVTSAAVIWFPTCDQFWGCHHSIAP